MSVLEHYLECLKVREQIAPNRPCVHCGVTLKRHVYLTLKEIAGYENDGISLELCEWKTDKSSALVLPSDQLPSTPQNPCDEEFMEDIST